MQVKIIHASAGVNTLVRLVHILQYIIYCIMYYAVLAGCCVRERTQKQIERPNKKGKVKVVRKHTKNKERLHRKRMP